MERADRQRHLDAAVIRPFQLAVLAMKQTSASPVFDFSQFEWYLPNSTAARLTLSQNSPLGIPAFSLATDAAESMACPRRDSMQPTFQQPT
jgi:hypothetical protein